MATASRWVRLLILIGGIALPGLAPGETVPLDPDARRTTDASIFLGNLDSRVDATEQVLASRTSAPLLLALAEDLDLRGRIRGRIADLERALALTAKAVELAPTDGETLRFRVRMLAYFHRFDEARKLLVDGPAFPGKDAELAALDAALGHTTPPVGEPPADEDFLGHVAHAQRLADHGRYRDAHAAFDAAQHAYRGVNPYPLAWLHVQHGILYLQQDDLASAARYFAAARKRLPDYYLAVEHLAEIAFRGGELTRAQALYRAVVDQTGHPEFLFQLSRVERALGDDAAADALLARANAGYEALLARHPTAWADHAARFYLETGRAPRALELARSNLALRRGVDAWLLVAEVAAGAGRGEEACEALAGARATGLKPPGLEALASSLRDCEEAATTHRAEDTATGRTDG